MAALAQECSLTLTVQTEAPHGSLSEGTPLTAALTYTPTRAMRMGSEATAYLTEGQVEITAPDGTGLTGRLRVIHVVRAPHWADYLSFDIADVTGDLGGVTRYEDPMLLSFYAERGALTSFDLPVTQADLAQFGRRQTFQVHTPDTMWTLPGAVLRPVLTCEPV
ncbi:MAG: hypothetical protein AAFZ09_13725 [Pseudomonadota bacterium]